MAAETWPASLPQAPEVPGYSNTDDDDVLRSDMAAGPDKVRNRTTASGQIVSMDLQLTSAQVATLKTFYKTTLNKTSPFNWKDHTDDSSVEYRFLSAPIYTPWQTSLEWNAALQLEILP